MVYQARRAADRNRLDEIFRHSRQAIDDSGWDPQLQSSLARYLCVLVSGFLEQSFRDVFCEYVDSIEERLSDGIVNLLERQLQSPNSDNVRRVAGYFHEEWRQGLKEYLGEKRGEALNSVVKNRHLIAHGESTDVGLVTVEQWYGAAKEVVDFVEHQCGLSTAHEQGWEADPKVGIGEAGAFDVAAPAASS